MPKLIITRAAWEDIRNVKRFTRHAYGDGKVLEYEDLIEEAYRDIMTNPTMGRLMLQDLPEVRGWPIAKPGRRARHIVFYRVNQGGDLEIVRFLHDAMDFKRHL